MHRRRTRGLAAALLLSTLAALGATAPAAAAEGDPVLLIHGYRGDDATWADTIAMFAAANRTAIAIDLPSEDNIVNANYIADYVASRGWSRVDIVGQSMGGLSARWYIKMLKPGVVDAYVSLGTPQYGLWSACTLPSWYGGQMCPSSSFLSRLNKNDDTPGRVAWTTIYSTTDGIVPTSASRLDGGACHVQVPGPAHNDMDNDPAVFSHVLAAVDGICTGTFK